jgi:hypothetical protein
MCNLRYSRHCVIRGEYLARIYQKGNFRGINEKGEARV